MQATATPASPVTSVSEASAVTPAPRRGKKYADPLTIRLPSGWRVQIEALAKQLGIDVSELTRRALRRFVREYGGEKKDARP